MLDHRPGEPELQGASDLPSHADTSVAESQTSAADTRSADRMWLRRWGELREWRIIVFIVFPVAPVLGLLTGGWVGWLISLGAPFGALARLYALRCPDCGARFAEGRLAPMPSECAVCGCAVFDNEPETPRALPSTGTIQPARARPDTRARRIARWDRFRKQLAAIQIAASAFGVVTLLEFIGEPKDAVVLMSGLLLVLVLAGIGGILLWGDRTGGVPLSLCYHALQIVLFHVDSARLWIVLGPYALVIVGPEGPFASAGFTYGFASVAGVGRAPDWVGVNLLALAAFWFLWRRPWREASRRSAPAMVYDFAQDAQK